MITIQNKAECCGCTACYNICPKEAIQMKPDFEGFLYPFVNAERCVECGLCDAVCPVQNPVSCDELERKSYVIRTKDSHVLDHSTSGGFITPLGQWVIKQNGVICGAAFNNDFKVVHKIVGGGTHSLSDLRGSKYVQSDLTDCFATIKRYLEQGTTVCFVGTTCQVYGLKKFLRKKYETLVTVDLVCHGTPSPKLWDKYLEYQKNNYHSEIEDISFRNKTYGYHSSTMRIQFKNGKTYYGSARVDPMLKSFFKEISSRPSCYQCYFKNLERCSDFTIYDCWHADQLVVGLADDDKGYTNLIVQSKKGEQVLEKIKQDFDIYPVDTERAIALDGIMVRNAAHPHPKREEYYQDMDRDEVAEHIEKFIPITKKDHLIEWSKKIIYRVGIYRFLKKKMS